VSAAHEVVHRWRFVAVVSVHRRLLAIEDVVESLLHLVHRVRQVVLLLEIADLVLQLAHELFDAHHAHVHARHVEAVLAHPLESLAGVEALHHQVGEGVECAVDIEAELVLRSVPAAVTKALHYFP